MDDASLSNDPEEESAPPQAILTTGLAVCGFGIGKSALTTLLEFPAENVTVRMQGERKTDLFKACKTILKEEGVSGFYRGWIPGYVRTFAKTSYQWSLIQALQNTDTAHVLDEVDPRKTLKNGFIGLTIACFDTAILAPIEKSKIQAILNTAPPLEAVPAKQSQEKIASQQLMKSWLASQPYRGSAPFFGEQLLGWVLFLIGQNEGQILAKQYFGEENANIYKAGLGLALGAAETALVLPLANLRTQMVLSDHNWTARQVVESAREMGLTGMHYGWKPALIRSMTAAICDIYFISYLEKKSDELR